MDLAPMFHSLFAARNLDQNPPHRHCGGSEKVAVVVPTLRRRRAHQPHVRLMYEGRRLQRVSGFFLRQIRRRQFPQIVVNERQKLAGRRWVTGFNLRQNPA